MIMSVSHLVISDLTEPRPPGWAWAGVSVQLPEALGEDSVPRSQDTRICPESYSWPQVRALLFRRRLGDLSRPLISASCGLVPGLLRLLS